MYACPISTRQQRGNGPEWRKQRRKHHVDLNDPYLVMSTQRLDEGHSDYLAMLSPPDFEHLFSPHEYVNGKIHFKANPNPTNTLSYMCIKSSHAFSLCLAEDSIFSFDVDSARKHKNSNGETASGTKLLPMLHMTYHILTSIKEKTSVDIVKSTDNYFNRPQSESAVKNDSSVNNNASPNTKSNNYVNSSSRDWEQIKV